MSLRGGEIEVFPRWKFGNLLGIAIRFSKPPDSLVPLPITFLNFTVVSEVGPHDVRQSGREKRGHVKT
jgi:hypothetical protein